MRDKSLCVLNVTRSGSYKLLILAQSDEFRSFIDTQVIHRGLSKNTYYILYVFNTGKQQERELDCLL